MMLTFLLALVMMLGLFLLLWAGVGFIQDKKFFSSAPKEELAVVEPKQERFKGQHILGWALALLGLTLMIGPMIVGAADGIRNHYTFLQFFLRFAVMLLLLKAFDIIFFDWVLLCNQGFGFFTHYYPEVAPVLSPKLFGYNKWSHLMQIAAMIAGSALLAWVCTLF